MPTSILEQDVYTWSERLKSFFYSALMINIGIFIRLVILPHLLPKEGDFIGTFRLFLFLDFIQVALIASQFIRFCFAALGFDKYRDNIEILRVGQAECPNCKKVCLMETYKVFEGIQQEKFGDIEYAWEDWRTRVHCTACCHTYSCDDDDDEKNMRNFAEGLAMVPSEKVRHRPMAKDSLREPLLPVEVV